MANPPGQGAPGLVPPTQDQGQQQVPPAHQIGSAQGLQQNSFGGYPPAHGVNGGQHTLIGNVRCWTYFIMTQIAYCGPSL